eukprot:CAMPEP_0118937072 /NCGR_PEP_ID=MMETSP1169-20130426/21514_1 /TAXON_ID=36882 /ORGANISM="Pyramimonas obovata, Strain CCMP722" /LENGTH=115 /DNA_ID=CAMNT_0006880595 /DNA_START=15 /DNA_END=362 /DNA_ORIENTATION=+
MHYLVLYYLTESDPSSPPATTTASLAIIRLIQPACACILEGVVLADVGLDVKQGGPIQQVQAAHVHLARGCIHTEHFEGAETDGVGAVGGSGGESPNLTPPPRGAHRCIPAAVGA